MTRRADLVDAALEATVGASFTRIGSAVRSRLDHWTPIDRYDLRGRVIVVTGANSGLGLAAARTLLADGATVVLLGRSAARSEAAREALARDGAGDRVSCVIADMGDLDAVRAAAKTLTERFEGIHALVHNAGALDDARSVSPQGIEQTVACHVVGPFLLTSLLHRALVRAAPSRVVWVSSGGMYAEALSVADLEMPAAGYDGVVAYARAKRAQVTLCEMMADRLRSDGIVVHAMHPGWADTPGVERSLPMFRRVLGPLLRTTEEGADTLVWLVADDGAPLQTQGRFWLDRRPRAIHRIERTRRSDTPEARAALWRWVVETSGAEGVLRDQPR